MVLLPRVTALVTGWSSSAVGMDASSSSYSWNSSATTSKLTTTLPFF